MKNCRLKLFILIVVGLASTTLYAQTDPGTANLTHRWNFNNGSIIDDIGKLEGILHGDALLKNNSLYTNTNGWFEIPAASIAINTYEEASQSIWFTPTGTNSYYNPLTWFGNTSGNSGVDYWLIQPANLNDSCFTSIACLDYSTPWTGHTEINIKEIDDQLLHNLVSIIDDTSLKLYLDGVLVGIKTLLPNDKLYNLSTAQASLAKNGYVTDHTWKGIINKFSLYNKALTDDEVLYLYQEGPEIDEALNSTTNSLVFDATTLTQSFNVSSFNLTSEILITIPNGITISPSTIPLNTKDARVTLNWDKQTPVDDTLTLTSGSQIIEIRIKTADDSNCASSFIDNNLNLVPNPTCDSVKLFSGWGLLDVVDIISDPENVYCGKSSIKIGDGIKTGSGSLDIDLKSLIKPNTKYISKFMAKTVDGFANIGVFGFNVPSRDFIKCFRTENKWKEIIFYFETGDSILPDCGIYINNWNVENKLLYVDNWELYETATTLQIESEAPDFANSNGLLSYFEFKENKNYDLVTKNEYKDSNIEFVSDRNGNSNAAIKFVKEYYSNVTIYHAPTPFEDFSFTTWVKPNRSILLVNEDAIVGNDFTQNFMIPPSHGGDTQMGMGISIGTNGIRVYGLSSNIFTSFLTYAVDIKNFTNITVNINDEKTELYINGRFAKSYPAIHKDRVKFLSNFIGGQMYNYNFEGEVDELAIWDRTLTASEIWKYYLDTNNRVFTNKDVIVSGRNFTIPVNTIKLNSVDSVSAYQFNFDYDPTLVEYIGYDTIGTLSNKAFVIENKNTLGAVKIASIVSDYIIGSGSLVNLNFKAKKAGYLVPSISKFLLNADTIKAVFSDTISIFSKYGDADANDAVQAYDAALTLQKSVGIDPIPSKDPLPWEDWREIAVDVDGDGTTTAYDAGLIIQKSIDLISKFPIEESNEVFQSVPATVDADITITKEWDNLIVRSYGNLIGLNLDIVNGNQYLSNPISISPNFIHATNINSDFYKLGMATAYPLIENSVLMIIPIKNVVPEDVEINIIVNNTPKTIKMNISTGIVENNTSQSIIYPNPTKDYINISGVENGSIKITDLNGKIILDQELKNTNKVDLQNISAGVYLYKIQSPDGIQNGKIIKE